MGANEADRVILTDGTSVIAHRSFRWWTVGLLAVMLCVRAVPSAAVQPALEAHWVEVKTLLARQAWREALAALDDILRATPKDPNALAWRRLCQKRLSEGVRFRVLSPREEQIVRDTLQQEQHTQARAAAARKALDRQLKLEQARWDAELQRLHRQTVQEEKTLARRQKQQAVERQRLAARPRPATPASVLPAATPAAPTPAPSEEAVVSTQPQGPQQSIELAPVTVTVAPAAPEVEEVTPVYIPSPEEVPPGAVQIFADQLIASTDRRLAVARGHVHVVFSDGVMTCEKATLFTDTKDIYAEGRVHLARGNEVFRGELVQYNTQTKKGRFLDATASNPPWHQHGRVIEHVAEGVLRLTPGYLTSCDLEPPHFRFQGRSSTVFADEKIVRGRNVTLAIEDFPFIYLPWLSAADRQSPFFFIPGKKKPWEQFALMGYRYEWPQGHQGALRLDWRRAFAWGTGIDHKFEDERWGKGLLKLYYNDEHNMRRKEDDLPKGAGDRRYRALWRHQWKPMPDTTMVTDLQKYSDADFRKEFLFREEFVEDSAPDSFISAVTNDPNYSVSTTVRKRLNRFQTVTEAYPDMTFSTRSTRIGDTRVYSDTTVGAANLQTKNAHSETDTDVVRASWTQGFSYALSLFKPIQMTPNVKIQQAYYTKDKQGGAERPQGERDVISGQFSTGTDASLKLFRIFPVTTNAWGLNLNLLRHVLTPTVKYSYVHRPTVPNGNLSFGVADTGKSELTFGIENKLQTKRRVTVRRPAPTAEEAYAQPGTPPTPLPSVEEKQVLSSVDLARFLISAPYSFRGNANKRGGRLGDWSFDLELFPWPWLRLESNWTYPSHFVRGSRDRPMTTWNLDLVAVGGPGEPTAEEARDIQTPARRSQELGPQLSRGVPLLPQGQWYLGLGHRYSHNDKTENVVQFDCRLSEKWQIGTFHRFTWKEVAGGGKRFRNVREYQYVLTRDLHDWIAELVYRVDREAGEEVWLTLTLKAYPRMPIEIAESYHQPKFGSQSSPFSPLR